MPPAKPPASMFPDVNGTLNSAKLCLKTLQCNSFDDSLDVFECHVQYVLHTTYFVTHLSVQRGLCPPSQFLAVLETLC